MPLRKLIIGVAGSLAALVVLVLVLPLFIPWERLEAKLSDQIEASIGGRLIVEGSMSLRILPWPTVRVTDVILTNPVSESGTEAMVRAAEVLLEVDLSTVLVGQWAFTKVTLVAPEISLIRFADGTANWSFVGQVRVRGAVPDTGDADQVEKFSINLIDIVGGQVTYRNVGTGFTRRFNDLNAAIFARSLSGPYQAEGDVLVGDTEWQYRLGVDALTEGRAVPVNLSFGAFGAEANFSGVLSGYPEEPRLSGSISGGAEDSIAFILSAGVNAEGSDIRPGRRGRFDGVINATEKAIIVEQLAVRVGTVDGRGELRIHFGQPSDVSLVINFEKLDFDAFQEAALAQEELLALGGDGVESNRQDIGSRPFALPEGFSMSVDAVVDELIYRGQRATDLGFSMDFAEGRAAFETLSVLLPSGALLGFDGVLEARDGEPYLIGMLELGGPNLSALLKWLGASRFGIGPLLPAKSFASSSTIEWVGDVIRLDKVRGDIGGASLSGRLTMGTESGLDALFSVGSVTLTAVAEGSGSEFEMDFAMSDLVAPGRSDGAKTLGFDIRGNISGARDKMTVEVFARLADGELRVAGEDIDLDDINGELIVTANHPDFDAFVNWLTAKRPTGVPSGISGSGTSGSGTSGSGPLAVEGKISFDGGKIEIYDLDGVIGTIALGGVAEISSEGGRIKIVSLLETGRLPLAWLGLPFLIEPDGSLRNGGGQDDEGRGEIASQFVSLWPSDQFRSDRLAAIDLELGLDADALVHGVLAVEAAHLDLAIIGGAIDLRVLEGDFLGGDLVASGTFIAGRDGLASASVRAMLTDADAGRLNEVGALQQVGQGWVAELLSPLIPGFGIDLSGGPVIVELDLSALGESPAGMAKNLSGRMVAVFEGVTLTGFDSCEIAAILAAGPGVISAPDDLTDGVSPATALAPFILQVNVRDGVGILNAPEISAGCATVQLAGAINFQKREVDFAAQVGFSGTGEGGVELPILEFAQSGAFGQSEIILTNRDEIAAFGQVTADDQSELAPPDETGGNTRAQVPSDAFRSLIENLLR